ncbi:MAG TPA: hypothetical protein VMR45_05590 [Patescibacteria group bacterium]|nr:hypothetical protein [Patescibacteria group bacterium]
MNLAQKITEYYFDHLEDLPLQKRFHFANRLATWASDPSALKIVSELRASIVQDDAGHKNFVGLFQKMIAKSYTTDPHMSAYQQRVPYFIKYSPVYGLESALFRLHYLEALYGLDERQAFEKVVGINDLLALEEKLLFDSQAVRLLSSYAVNFSYLLHNVLLKDDKTSPKIFYQAAQNYDISDPESLRLLAYLYTHCIIADSNFYTRTIPEESLAIYISMLKKLEQHIGGQYYQFSLDVKLEFLVCARICNYGSNLAAKINDECQNSLSDEGTFIVDAHNAHALNSHKRSFAGSEHRNVLFIMSTQPYKAKDSLNI